MHFASSSPLLPSPDIAQHQSEMGEEISVKVAARLAQNLAYENKDALQAGLIIAGWDKASGGTLWGIPLGGTMMQAPYAMGGSGSAYIYGFCDKVRIPVYVLPQVSIARSYWDHLTCLVIAFPLSNFPDNHCPLPCTVFSHCFSTGGRT